MNGVEISTDNLWKAAGAVVLMVMGVIQMLFWRWLKLEKKDMFNHIDSTAASIEKAATQQVRQLEGDFRDFKEVISTRAHVLESLRGEDVKRFDAFDKKLDTIQEENRQSTKDLRQDIQNLSNAVMNHVAHNASGDRK